jgi:predicted enzyme related to lactoylglutathione lyase
MSHPVVWFEVMGRDGAKLQQFYTDLFGWKIDAANPMKYGMVEATEGRGIPGGVGQLSDNPWPKVTFYVSTTDINGSLEEAGKLGGKTLMPRTELPGGTILGFFVDPEGNSVGLVEEAA